jgi:SAM-dependent methyltransferase
MRPLTEEGVAFLQTPRAAAELERLADADGSALSQLDGLRRAGFSTDEGAWLLDQVSLRTRAEGKLASAERLLLTSEALEQATAVEVATWRAERFAGRTRVLDLGAGVGGDTLSMAGAGLAVLAVERDPVRAALLRHNVDALGLGALVEVRCEQGGGPWWAEAIGREVDAAFVDPARRRGGRRLLDLEQTEPPLSQLLELNREIPELLVKAAPGLDLAQVPAEAGLEFVSLRGELKEALLCFGALRRGPEACAVLLPGPHLLTGAGSLPPRVAAPGDVLLEPDPAVIRAGLVRALAQRLDAWQLDSQVAYLSCADDPGPTPFARRWRVLRHGRFQRKQLTRWLREVGVGRLIVKRRGVPVDPDELARRLPKDPKGPERYVFLCRTPRTPLALVAEPIRE